MTKQCKTCGEIKPVTQFRSLPNRPKIIGDVCDACKYDEHLARNRRRYQETRGKGQGTKRIIDRKHQPWKPREEDMTEVQLLNECLLSGIYPKTDEEWDAMCNAAVTSGNAPVTQG